MTQHEIVGQLHAAFGERLGAWREMTGGSSYQRRMGSHLEIADPSSIRDLAFYLRDDPSLDFNNLMLLSSLDNADGTLSIVYHVESTRLGHQIALKATFSAEDASVPSVTSVWAHANWHEREAWDMMGIHFEGHPDLRRMLLDEDYPGHPLRKDFKEPDFYHGMKVPY